MRILYFIICILLGVALNINHGISQVNITTCNQIYNMNFNVATMAGPPCSALTFNNNSTIQGWYIQSDGSLITQTWNSVSGCPSGAHYSFGSAPADRALGTLSDGATQTQRTGVRFSNQSSSIITQITVTYTGEQWRQGASVNLLTFDYSVNATDLITGTYTAVPGLTHVATNINPVPGVLDGNLLSNRTTHTQTITGLNILPGGELWLRWTDLNNPGGNAGIGIDDLTVQFSGIFMVFPGARETVVCNDNSATNFSVTADDLVTSCTWTVPTGAVITGDGTPNVSYDWSSVAQGSYTITATPIVGTCPGTQVNFSVTVVPAADANFTFANNPSCENMPVTLSATDIGQDFYTWQTIGADINPPGTSGPHIINYPTSGTYTIGLGTTKSSTVTIPSQTFYNFTDFTTENTADCNSGINSFNSTINVSGVNTTVPTGITVNVNLDHTFDSDVNLVLISPSGTSLVLCSAVGSNGDNFRNTTFSDAAATPISSGTAPFTGSFRPDGRLTPVGCTIQGTITNLDGFTGTSALGIWTLRMEDNFSGDFGVLKNWSITFPGHDNTISCNDFNLQNIQIDSPPVVGSLGSDQTVCEGINTGSLELIGNMVPITRWEYTEDGVNIFPITNITNTHIFNNLLVDTDFRVILQGTGGCIEAPSNWVKVTVNPNTNGGTLQSDMAFCGDVNNGTLNLTGYVGDIIQWETSTDFVNFTPIPNLVDFLDFVNLTQTTQVKVLVQSGVCEPMYSSLATITIDYPVVPGMLSGDQTVCLNSNASPLVLSDNTGTIVQWESSTDGFITYSVINNTNGTYSPGVLSMTTQFRVLLDGGACGTDYSPVAEITVIDPGLAGIVLSDLTTCSGSSGTLILTNYSGTVLYWESSVNNFLNVITIANNTPILTYSNLTVTTRYRAVTSAEPCGNLVSSAAKITIVQNAIPGNLVRNQTPGGSCDVSSGTLSLNGSLGNILWWESSTDNFVTSITIANTTTVYSYSISVPTSFRVALQNPPCGLVYSNDITVTPGLGLLANAYLECNNRGKIVSQGTGGSNTYTYVIVPNAGIQFPGGVFTGLPPGTYTITVKDEYNCSAVTTVKIPNKLSSPKISSIFNITNTSTKVIWNAVNPGNVPTYQIRYRISPNGPWTTKNVSTYSYVITGLTPDTDYNVSVRVRCTPYPAWSAWSAPTTFRTMLRTDSPILDETTDGLFTLFPNPNRGEFNLKIETVKTEQATINIIDLTGRIIFSNVFNLSEGVNTLQIQPENIASGTYILQAIMGTERKMIKLIVE